jgi:effector-binding domain-containing protein
MVSPCTIEERATQQAVVIRTRSSIRSLGGTLRKALGEIMAYLENAGATPAGPPFAAYYNADMDDLDVEIGMPVKERLPGAGDIGPGEIAGARFAACLYTGPYSGIGAAYEELARWMKDGGHVSTGVAYEFYLTDPGRTPAKDLQTRVLFPLKQ